MNIFECIMAAIQWLVDLFVAYFTRMAELFRNTFDSTNRFPELDFTVDWHYWKNTRILQYAQGWFDVVGIRLKDLLTHQQKYNALNALVYAFTGYLLVYLLCWCVCCGKRSRKRGPTSPSDSPAAAVTVTKHHAREANRWLTQAEHDHQSAMNDMHDDTPAFEWVCFKCQQASEKAIKAALIMKQPEAIPPSEGHDLVVLSGLLGDSRLKELAAMLHGHIGVASRMRYPDLLPFPRVPRDVYTEQIATHAWDVTGEILTHVQQQYMDNH